MHSFTCRAAPHAFAMDSCTTAWAPRGARSCQARVVFAALAISRQAALRCCLRCRASILKFECFEPGKIGAGGRFEFTGPYGAYDPGFVAGPEHQDGHPARAGPHHASYCAIFVTWTAAAVPGPNDGSRRDQVACVKHTIHLLRAGSACCAAAMLVILPCAVAIHTRCIAALLMDSDSWPAPGVEGKYAGADRFSLPILAEPGSRSSSR